MDASIHERIAAAVALALYDADQAGDEDYETIAGIGERVFRAREDGITAEEGDTLNVFTGDCSVQPFSTEVDDNRLEINVSMFVRGDVWETKADGYAPIVQQRVLRYSYIGAGIKLASIRMGDQSWQGEGGNNTPGKRTLTLLFRFLTLTDDITKQP